MTNLNPTCWWSIFNSSNHPKNLGPLKLWWWKIIIDGVCIEENIFIHKIKTIDGNMKRLEKTWNASSSFPSFSSSLQPGFPLIDNQQAHYDSQNRTQILWNNFAGGFGEIFCVYICNTGAKNTPSLTDLQLKMAFQTFREPLENVFYLT